MKKFGMLLLCIMLLSVQICAAESADGLSNPHLDYALSENWSYWPEENTHPADLFIIAPTVDIGKAGNLLADMSRAKYLSSFTGALNMELGIYDDVCDIYAPYYQQATFPVYNMDAAESAAYFAYAYEDVSLAFQYYLEHCEPDRPIVLAGFSQGADMAIRLTEEYFDDEALAKRLVAVYAIGWRVTEEDIQRAPQLHMAQGETDTGVIVAFNSESEETNGSTLVPEGTHTFAINPLNWKTDATVADASLNLGACFTDYSGAITGEIPAFCGAYLNPERGTLKVPGIDNAEYPGKLFPDGVYHLYDYQFFFRNLENNVQARVEAFLN